MGHELSHNTAGREATEKAWTGWVFFTKCTTVAVVASGMLLGLMALFLL